LLAVSKQLFQPCSSPEQSKAIADLSSAIGVGSGMTFCAQPATAQASAIKSLSCTLFSHPPCQPDELLVSV